MKIAPIQTRFNGTTFRSKLEARWATFFYMLNIRYQYEPEGYHVTDDNKVTRQYLPDFFLPDVYYRDTETQGWQVEVKPLGTFNEKLDLTCKALKQPGILLAGGSIRQGGYFQHGEHIDENMEFRYCEACGSTLIGFSYKHCKCPKCGGYADDKPVIEAADIANNYFFDRNAVMPWPRQPVNDSGFPF